MQTTYLESGEENVEQDDTMEKSPEVENETESTYVSNYPNTRRYSLANTMATNKPLLQGFGVEACGDFLEREKTENQETKIDMPASQPPQYSALHEKTPDKKVKVSRNLWSKLSLSLGEIVALICINDRRISPANPQDHGNTLRISINIEICNSNRTKRLQRELKKL